jgi:hypothetical protein
MQITSDISIFLTLLIIELKAVNTETAKCPLLERIIEEVVPERALEAIYLRGLRNDEIHARVDINIRYEVEGPRFCVERGADSRFSMPEAYAQNIDHDRFSRSTGSCPVWRETLRLFMQILRERSLRLGWAVQFSRQHEEFRQRYGLVSCHYRDCTLKGHSHTVANSILDTLGMTMRINPDYMNSWGGITWNG